jgi:anti-sigma factor RsiW
MTAPSFHDVEQLSAYLDGQLSLVEKTRLETRLHADPVLASLLDDLRNTRLTLRHIPKRPVPRNFTLDPRKTRIRPPVPRLVPALSWASAVAAFLFIVTLGGNLIGQLSFGAAAPMLSAAPMTNQGSGLGAEAPSAVVQSPLTDKALNSPTPEAYSLVIPQATPSVETRNVPPLPSPTTPSHPVNIWLVVWPGLALLLLGSALLIRWLTLRAFHHRLNK